MVLSNKVSCEAGSFLLQPQAPQVFTARGFEALFPALELWVAWSVLLPSYSSRFICMQMWDHLVCQPLPHPPHPPAAPLCPPVSLDECFFFNSLVVRLPYSSIFWQFWLFFVFKFVVVLLLVVQGGKVYLPTPPSWPEVPMLYFFDVSASPTDVFFCENALSSDLTV